MNHFKNMNEWKKQWDHFFGEDFWGSFEPLMGNVQTQVNIYKAENECIVVISLPGLASVDDVDLFTHYQTLEVKGKNKIAFEGFELTEEGIIQGKFERVIKLPFPIREDRVEAEYDNGLLIIRLHRLIPDENRRRIAVRKND